MGSSDIYCALCAGPFHQPSRTSHSDSDSDLEAIDPETEEGRGPDVANGSIIGRREMAVSSVLWINNCNFGLIMNSGWMNLESLGRRIRSIPDLGAVNRQGKFVIATS